MIATLTGVISENYDGNIVLEVNGVGYGISITNNDQGTLKTNETVKLYIYENIKEDTHDLIGFKSIDTKRLFMQLLSVKNVGPKVALAILDIGNDTSVRAAIAGGDVKYLQTAKGVGKRAAEQVVVELRDKVGAPVGEGAEQIIGRSGINTQDEAVQALVALGYSDADAQIALNTIDPLLPLEDRIRLALKR